MTLRLRGKKTKKKSEPDDSAASDVSLSLGDADSVIDRERESVT
jgi:hypothetical protein